MDRDVYAKLLENLTDLKDLITGMSGDVGTKLTPIVSTGTVPSEGSCSVEVGELSDLYGWQWLVENSSGVWADVNQITYYNDTDDSIYLYLIGDSASYRGKDYKLIVYKLAQPAVEG